MRNWLKSWRPVVLAASLWLVAYWHTLDNPWRNMHVAYAQSPLVNVTGGACGSGTANTIMKFTGAQSCGNSNLTDSGSSLVYTPASTSATTHVVNDGTNNIFTVATDNGGTASAPRVIVGNNQTVNYSLVLNNGNDSAGVYFQNAGTSRYQIKSTNGYLNILELGGFNGFSFGVNGATHGVGVGQNGLGGDNWRVLRGGIVSIYDGINTAGLGQPFIAGSAVQTAQVAAITTTNLVASVPANAGYTLDISVTCTTTSAAAVATYTLAWTDTGSQAQSVTGLGATCTALGAASYEQRTIDIRAKSGTAITYAVAITNTPTYDVWATATQKTTN